MPYRSFVPLLWCALIIFAAAPARAQETADSGQSPSQSSATRKSPSELHDKFESMPDPPLVMGDTGNRVKELQATLNKILRGQPPIELRHPIMVGPALPESAGNDLRNKQRLAWSMHRNKAFQLRGDWIPLDQNGKDPTDGAGDDLVEVFFLDLPNDEDPLKVDGIFGQHTKAAVALFQHQQNLPITGDVDSVTLDKLEPLVPTNPLLAFTMSKVKPFFSEQNEYYPNLVKTCTSIAVTLLILIGAAVVFQVARSIANSTHFLSRWLFTPESSPWFTALYKKRFFRRGAHFGPALFLYLAGLLVFPTPAESTDVFPYLNTFQDWNYIVSHVGLAYMSLALTLVGFASANAIDAMANPDQETDNPIGSIIRAAKRLIGLIGTLLIVASLAGRSPFLIIGGLGAFMAVIMLVFRDYLLGLVSSIQIIANRVVKIGDWVSMPKYHADGEVRKISLTLITVQNADKTISTIPTSAVLSESFQNWSGVEHSGVRRIKRSLLIDIRRIRVCTPEMIERFERIELLHDYLTRKKEELEEYNRRHEVEASAVNSRRLTNIGTFRAYLDRYLGHHPDLSPDMTILVRHLQPTSCGLPIEIYAFAKTTEWLQYEALQADIFDHVLAILPEFGLRAYQQVTEIDADAAPPDRRQLARQAGLAELESLIETKNRELAANPRTRSGSRMQSIRKRIADLDLSDDFAVEANRRKIVLKHLRDS
jgi:miniconductance mechanosensitive channel